MFGIEICSPFFIGYLNKSKTTKEMYAERKAESIALVTTRTETKQIKNWKTVDYTKQLFRLKIIIYKRISACFKFIW